MLFAPVRQTLSNGTSPPKIVRPFMFGRWYTRETFFIPMPCSIFVVLLAGGNFACACDSCEANKRTPANTKDKNVFFIYVVCFYYAKIRFLMIFFPLYGQQYRNKE